MKKWWKTVNTLQRRHQTAELLFETVVAFNQPNNYGAVAKWCNSQSPPLTAESKLKNAVLEVRPHHVTRLAKHKTLDHVDRGNLVHIRGEELKELQAAAQLTQVCEDGGFTKTGAK